MRESITQDVLPAIIEDREIDGNPIDMKVFGSGDMVFDADALDSRSFDLKTWNVKEHTQGTLVVTVRASSTGLLDSEKFGQAHAIRAILKCNLSISQNECSGQSKIILAPLS